MKANKHAFVFAAAALCLTGSATAEEKRFYAAQEADMAACLDKTMPEHKPWSAYVATYRHVPNSAYGITGGAQKIEESADGTLVIESLNYGPQSNPFDAPGTNHEGFYPISISGVKFKLQRKDVSEADKAAFQTCRALRTDDFAKVQDHPYSLCIRDLFVKVMVDDFKSNRHEALRNEESGPVQKAKEFKKLVSRIPHVENGLILVNSIYNGPWPIGSFPLAFKMDQAGGLSHVYVAGKRETGEWRDGNLPTLMLLGDSYRLHPDSINGVKFTPTDEQWADGLKQVERMNYIMACVHPLTKTIKFKGYEPLRLNTPTRREP